MRAGYLCAAVLSLAGCVGVNRPVRVTQRPPERVVEASARTLLQQLTGHNEGVSGLEALLPAVVEFEHALQAYYAEGGRVWIIPRQGKLTDLAPWRHLEGKELRQDVLDSDETIVQDASGVRGVTEGLNVALGEEYLHGGYQGIPLRSVRHEFAHVLYLMVADTHFDHALRACFARAGARGVFLDRYSRTDELEYFAEGVVAYLNDVPDPRYAGRPEGDIYALSRTARNQRDIENFVTRSELRFKDQGLFTLVRLAFERSELLRENP